MHNYLLLIIGLFFIGPTYAQTVEQDGKQDSYSMATQRAQSIFLTGQEAIFAEDRCNNRSFSEPQLVAINRTIAADMKTAAPTIDLGAARLLNLRRQAHDTMYDIISDEGCSGPHVKAALDMFDQKFSNFSADNTQTPSQPTAAGSAQAPAASMAPEDVPLGEAPVEQPTSIQPSSDQSAGEQEE